MKKTLLSLLSLLLIAGVIVGVYFVIKSVNKTNKPTPDARKTSISISEDGIMTIYDKNDEAKKVIYFSVLGQKQTELYYTSMLAGKYKKDKDGYYGIDADLKNYGSFDTDSIYALDIYFYWAEFGSLFLGDHSKVYLQKKNNLNQQWRMYFVYGEDGKFYNPNDYYDGKVQSITTLYPIPSVFMQY